MVKSITDGVDGIIDEGLNLSNIGGDPQYQHKKSCSIAEKHRATFDANEVVSKIYEQLVTNLKDPDNRFDPKGTKGPFEVNWRLKKHTTLPDPNSDIDQTEKEIERAIVNLQPSLDWFNQVPTSLGLIITRDNNKHSDQFRNIDLVHRLGEEVYEFIELKVKSDTPMYAAFEIVVNGLIYLVLRESYKEQYTDIDPKKIIKARKVHLQTLAPQDYYSGYSLRWLETKLNEGLKTLASEKFNNNFKIDFKFKSFPEDFKWQCEGDKLVDALNNRISVYPKSITDGVDKIIDEGLNLLDIGTTAPHFQHKKSCLIKETPATFDANEVVSRIYEQLVTNLKNPDNEFHSEGPSKENWRFEKKPEMPHNPKSKREEMELEKTIVKFPDWVNQVPTSFRLIAPHSDIKRNIDLVHRLGIGKGAYEFIELKVEGGDTPMSAAFQIVVSGLIYLMSREFYTSEYIDSKDILKARKVHLQTLAPHGYYSDYSLEWLENELNKGLKTFVSEKFNNIEIDFTFTSFPESFVWPCKDKDKDNELLVEALENIVSVY